MAISDKDVLLRLRRGAHATLSFKAIGKALAPVGWVVTQHKEMTATLTRYPGAPSYEHTGPGVVFTSPRGETVRTVKEPGYNCIPTHQILPAVYKLGLIEDICAHLGMPHPDEERAMREATFNHTDVTNTGSCPACFGLYKLTDQGKMVHHGYQRPGIGYIIGDCFGVGYEPFELSNAGTVAYVEKLRSYRDGMVVDLATLVKAGPEFYNARVGAGGMPAMEQLYENATTHLERQITHLDADIKMLDQMIADWKLLDLPEVRKARGERLLRLNYQLVKRGQDNPPAAEANAEDGESVDVEMTASP